MACWFARAVGVGYEYAVRTRRAFRVTVAASAVSCAALLAGCGGSEPTDAPVSTQRYFPKTAAVAESPPTPTTAPPSTTTVEAVDVADPVTEPATSTDDGIPYGDVCTQVEEFRDALGEFTGQPVSDQDAIDATIEFYRTEGASAGMDEATLNGLVELLRDC